MEDLYWQQFCGERFIQRHFSTDPNRMACYRYRIGERGCELILQQTVEVSLKNNAVKRSDLKRVSVNTTVQMKAVSYPTDSKLFESLTGKTSPVVSQTPSPPSSELC